MIQRRSRDRLNGLQVPDEFIITSLEIIVHRYTKLGSGGFAEVYEAEWNRTKVAVKIFPRGVMPSVRLLSWGSCYNAHRCMSIGAGARVQSMESTETTKHPGVLWGMQLCQSTVFCLRFEGER